MVRTDEEGSWQVVCDFRGQAVRVPDLLAGLYPPPLVLFLTAAGFAIVLGGNVFFGSAVAGVPLLLACLLLRTVSS